MGCYEFFALGEFARGARLGPLYPNRTATAALRAKSGTFRALTPCKMLGSRSEFDKRGFE